jgi:hypothetical protein
MCCGPKVLLFSPALVNGDSLAMFIDRNRYSLDTVHAPVQTRSTGTMFI